MDYTPNPRTFRMEGFEELEQQLLQVGQMYRTDLVARQTLSKAANEAMMVVLYSAAMDAPYDSKSDGPIHLRNTIRLDSRIPTEADKRSEYVNETDAVISVVSAKKSAVSLSQEFGNARTSAQPFLRPALESNAERVISSLKDSLSRIIPEYVAKLNRRRKK
jgi:HK97 gp10 family phage protein